jgi:hypothetical protein
MPRDPRNRRPASLALTPEQAAEVERIYAEVDRRVADLPTACRNQTVCCQFARTGQIPVLTLGEALHAARGLRASGRRSLPAAPSGSCPLLGQDGRCLIYRHRPLGCRTHFCAAAGGIVPRRLVADLIHDLEAVDSALGGQGARPLPAALAAVL